MHMHMQHNSHAHAAQCMRTQIHTHTHMNVCACAHMCGVTPAWPQPHVQAGFPTALAALASLEAFNKAR